MRKIAIMGGGLSAMSLAMLAVHSGSPKDSGEFVITNTPGSAPRLEDMPQAASEFVHARIVPPKGFSQNPRQDKFKPRR